MIDDLKNTSIFFEKELQNVKQQFLSNVLPHSTIFYFPQNIITDSFLTSFASIVMSKNIYNIEEESDIYLLDYSQNHIDIDILKSALNKLNLSSHSGKTKLIIIKSANLMNEYAINALLKSLEEPKNGVYFALTALYGKKILDTVKSRSQQIFLKINSDDTIKYLHEKFNMDEKSVSKALKITSNNLDIIIKIKTDIKYWQMRLNLMSTIINKKNIYLFIESYKELYKDIIYWLLSLVIDSYLLHFGASEESLANYDQIHLIKLMSESLGSEKIYLCYKGLLQSYSSINQNNNINAELAIASHLLDIQQEIKC